MILFPSVDILDGKAVRLLYGDRNRVTDYGDPVEVVSRYIASGAEIVHVVDLNGAFDHSDVNFKILKTIGKLPVKKQLGGGIHSLGIAENAFDIGFERVVLGSACVNDLPLVETLCSKYGNLIVGCLDTKDGKVCTKGWKEVSNICPEKQALKLRELGITDIVFTDVSRDGAMTGVNAQLTAKLQKESGMNIIASGGVKDHADLQTLTELGVYGAILGKSLYLGTINLREAIKQCTQNA